MSIALNTDNMNEKDKARLQLQILEEEYTDPDFGFSWKTFLMGFVIGILAAWIFTEIF